MYLKEQGGKNFFTTDVPRAHPYFFRCARSPIRAHPGLRAVVLYSLYSLIEKKENFSFPNTTVNIKLPMEDKWCENQIFLP